jgi:CHAD domain-containing protein
MRRHLKEVEGPAAGRKALLDSLVDRRGEARRKLLTSMQGSRYARVLQALVEAAQVPPLNVDGDQRAAGILPGLAAAPWKALAKAVQKLPKEPADEQLHAVRIAAKRARYAAEAAAPISGKPAARFAEAVAGLQQTLGDFNDAVVARTWLTSVAPSLDQGGAFYAGVLSERERSLGQSAAAGWKRAWKAVDQGKLHRWMLE